MLESQRSLHLLSDPEGVEGSVSASELTPSTLSERIHQNDNYIPSLVLLGAVTGGVIGVSLGTGSVLLDGITGLELVPKLIVSGFVTSNIGAAIGSTTAFVLGGVRQVIRPIGG